MTLEEIMKDFPLPHAYIMYLFDNLMSPGEGLIDKRMLGDQMAKLFFNLWPFFLNNGASLASFPLFLSFQTNITILTTNKCEKRSFSIQCWDSNP